MKLQKLSTLTTFTVLLNMLNVHGMEPNYDAIIAIQQAEEHNRTHPLLCFPLELQHQIAFPCGTTITQVTEDNADELKEQVKAFFTFKKVCKCFNEKLKSPWTDVDLATKNKMMEEVNVLMTQLARKEYSKVCNRWDFYKHSEKVSFGYKKYRAIPLALVCSGADADVTNGTVSTTTLSKAVYAEDELAVALLLDHKADPYQKSHNEREYLSCFIGVYPVGTIWYGEELPAICFRAPTEAIAKLFAQKNDKQKLSSTPIPHLMISKFMLDCCSSELMPEQYNHTRPLLNLPREVQQQIVSIIMEITEDHADELNEQFKTFFSVRRVCRYFNEMLEALWLIK